MRTCREISMLISEGLDRDLSLRERAAVRIHLMMCRLCSAYRSQLYFIRKALHRHIQTAEGEAPPELFSLSEEEKERIRHRLAQGKQGR